MSDSNDIAKSIVNSLDSIGKIFLHLLPGVLVVFIFYKARPSWFDFDKVNIAETQSFIILFFLTIVAGNVWFVFHRYGIQQLIDFFFLKRIGKNNYYDVLVKRIWRFFSTGDAHKEIKNHIRFRYSSVVLMYIVAEVAIVAGLIAKRDVYIGEMRVWFIFGGLILFVAAFWQDYILFRIEGYFVEKIEKEGIYPE